MSDRDPLTIKKKRSSQRKCKSVKKRLKVGNDSKTKVENNHFERLPNEILLEIVDYLHIGDLLRCGQTCRKIRAVVHDESLWNKVNFFSCTRVPTGLLKLVLEHGCEYLDIHDQFFGHLTLNQDSQLKLLNLDLNHYYVNSSKIFEPLLNSCYSLEKLQLSWYDLKPHQLSSICTQNRKTLKVLKLNSIGKSIRGMRGMPVSTPGLVFGLSIIQPFIDQCVELEELTFCQTRLTKLSIDYLVKNITPKVSKLCLCTNQAVRDEHIRILVGRCPNLTELNLKNTGITNDSLSYIIKNLQSTLEKLGLPGRFFLKPVNFTKLFELKAMKKLTVLDLHQDWISDQDILDSKNYFKLPIESLKLHLPNVEIVHMWPALVIKGLSDDMSNYRCYEY